MSAAVQLLPPGAGSDDERWHELRRAGVTASEIAAVLGISPWESAFSLYWRKVNGWRTDDSEILSAGRYVEPAAAAWWQSAAPVPGYVMCPAGLYAHPDRPWQLATPDRLLCDGQMHDNPFPGDPSYRHEHPWQVGALLECKWVAYSWDGWGDPGTDDIPVYYRAQALWQLDVLGVDEVHFAVLGPGGFRAYGPVRRDEDDLAVMRKAGEEFVRRLADDDPPPLDGHSATLGALKQLHPSVGDGEVEVAAELAVKYRVARAAKKVAEERIAECEAEIRAALGSDFNRAVCSGERVASRSVYTTRRIDTAALRERYPEAAADCLTESTVDKLTPARSKS